MLMEELWIWLRVYKCKTIFNKELMSSNRFLKFKIFFDELGQNLHVVESNMFLVKRFFQSEFKFVRFGPMTF